MQNQTNPQTNAEQTEDDKQQADMRRLVKEIEEQPDNWQAYADLVNVLTATGNFVEAEELGLKSLSLFEADAEAKAYLAYSVGNVYYAAGSYAQAQNYFQLVQLPELAHDVTMMQAQDWFAQKNYKQALAFAVTGTEQDAQDVAAFDLLGNIWLALDQFDEAKTAFEQALTLDADDFEANFGRGLLAQVANPDAQNTWFTHAEALDAATFKQKTQQLDDLHQVIVNKQQGEQTADGQPTE
ncbi:tetratricopeptide repeat protein [Weissella viridescens]|uniref:Tetratricopeptide repeat protein n=1 Tax=Weissella viridescens TaxID=1629 RepID=A0A3P2RBQ2_WEIVI|nr:tetratricopeptide repeat protein [Weissella viridescens]RRG18013.1 tetratricopeptide repeat protein [Weissella viridescens]